ncbi:Thiol-disulfide isomerase or thioredoxin [Sphingobacterium nematocida]|uniref:Thiol-disulfide isomerase or thioredoxin n=1 Tax=Sphingobacterium nematocida TaxID=1513896 RepID=A0A1T5B059_9SPHI|nr:TlpA disulfide reductase family protein [Sphingobacterium nematocida]SKB40605.1 Thiol-disulfide isomerase or thioredoxin [Sphingobacterium nematocida]
MRGIYIIFCVLFSGTLASPAFGQEAKGLNKIKPLKIGDTIPDSFKILNVSNFKTETITAPDLKGKWTILDFWNTTCGSCIASFPKLHQLQSDFHDKIQVILLNTHKGDTEPSLARFLKKTETKLSLPYALGQEEVKSYFPHRFIPHCVWIDPTGKIVAITTSEQVNEDNLQMLTSGFISSLPTKRDDLFFDVNMPLLVHDNGGADSLFAFRSLLTPYLDGIGTTVGRRNMAGNRKRIFALNQSMYRLLQMAYPSILPKPRNRVIIESVDSLDVEAKLEDRSLKNSFCYELIVPNTMPERIENYLMEDMARFFGLRVNEAKRMMPCYRIVADGSVKPSTSDIPIVQIGEHKNLMKRVPLSFALAKLDHFFKTPIINETGKDPLVDLELPEDMNDEKALISSLKNIGLGVMLDTMEIDVAVIYTTKKGGEHASN